MKDSNKIDDATLCRIGVLPFLRKIKSVGNGQLSALCPFHDDQRQSFSVNKEAGLWTCFAGCGSGNAVQFFAKIKGLTEAEAYKELAGTQPSSSGNGRRIVAAYSYHDEDGQLLFQVVRYDPKSFRQRRPDGKGGWTWNLNGIKRVLYHLPEIVNEEVVYIVEGEKDVDRLRSLRTRVKIS